jgi:hypothetical protein
VLFTLAAAILGLSRLLPRAQPHYDPKYDPVPLDELLANEYVRSHSPHISTQDVVEPKTSPRLLRTVFVVLVTAICLRIEVARQVMNNVQCSRPTWEPIIPLAFAVIDYVWFQRKQKRAAQHEAQRTLAERLEHRILQASYGYVLAVGITCFGAVLALRTTTALASTHICASVLPYNWSIPLLQYVGTALDVAILSCIGQLLHQEEGRGHRSPALRFSAIGWAVLVRC